MGKDILAGLTKDLYANRILVVYGMINCVVFCVAFYSVSTKYITSMSFINSVITFLHE